MIKVDKLNPFGRMCISLGMLPSSYKESLTYEEQLLWFFKYLDETVIPTVNNNADAVEELQALYIEIKNYVDNYFDNLDVQEEINNKLDDMADSGELSDIIAQYLQLAGVLAFNTLSDLEDAENIVNGSICLTLGKLSYNDGKGSYYKIRNILNTDVVDGEKIIAITNNDQLVGEKIPNYFIDEIYKDIFYKEITYTMNRSSNTDYFLTSIPKYDENGELINLVIEKDTENTPIKHAQKYLTSFTCNATLAVKDSDDTYHNTLVISNGEIINPVYNFTNPLSNDYQYLCIDDSRNFTSYQANNTTPETLLNNGVKQAWLVFYKVIENGVFIDHDNDISNASDDIRQIIGVKQNGDVILLTNNGRTSSSYGFDDEQACNILISNGVVNAWEMDGGGSASTEVKTIKINQNYDDKLTSDRNIPFTLNAKKSSAYTHVGETYAEISRQKQEYNNIIMNYINNINNFTNVSLSTQTIVGNDTYNTLTGFSRTNYYGNTHVNVQTNKITILKTGVYTLNGFIETALNSGSKYIEIFVNNEQRYIMKFTGSSNEVIVTNNPVTCCLNLNIDDELEIKYYGANNDKIERGYIKIQYYGI